MTFDDLKTKSKDELIKTLLDLKKEQMEKRFQLASAQLGNTAEMRRIRRDIARVQTALNAPAEQKTASAKPAKKVAAKKTKTA